MYIYAQQGFKQKIMLDDISVGNHRSGNNLLMTAMKRL